MVEVGGDNQRSSSPTSLLKQGYLEHIVQDCVCLAVGLCFPWGSCCCLYNCRISFHSPSHPLLCSVHLIIGFKSEFKRHESIRLEFRLLKAMPVQTGADRP